VPELPEVELCRRELAPALPGRLIAAFRCTQPGIIRAPLRDVAGFAAAVVGRTLTGVERRGKQLLLRLDRDEAIRVGFGLWARLELRPAPAEELKGAELALGGEHEPDAPAASTGPAYLAFTEIALANLAVVPYAPASRPPPYDALDPGLDGRLLAVLAPPRAAVKAFLTDDRFVAGLGNGYADELLWAARVHPRRPAGSLAEREWAAVAVALRDVLTAALEAGGEADFRSPLGGRGAYERRIHHHGGEPCPRCGATLGSSTAGRRETNFCPVCQPF